MRLLLLIFPSLLAAATQLSVLNSLDNRPVPRAQVITADEIMFTDANGSVTLPENVGRVRVKAYGFRPLEGTIDPGTAQTTLYARPITVKAVYLSFWGASRKDRLDAILKLARTTEINAVVIDVKNELGLTSYKTGVPEAGDISAHRYRTIKDMQRFMQALKSEGIYTIGRIVVFKDDLRSEHRPEIAVHDANGSRWQNGEGLGWLDPFIFSNQKYNVDIAEDAAKMGFDEINFDYIRFPETPGLQFARKNSYENRIKAVSAFLQWAKERLTPYGVFLSADTFGHVSWDKGDTGIGQTMASMKAHVDYFSPMLYPSGFAKGFMGLKDPTSDVYRVVSESLRQLDVEPVRVRPWLQAFRDYAHSRTPFRARRINGQITAAAEHGSGGWLLWNPSSRYSRAGLRINDAERLRLARNADESNSTSSPAKAAERIAAAPKPQDFDKTATPKKAEAVSGVSEISGLLSRYTAQLCADRQQRVAIARALVTKPELLWPDKATNLGNMMIVMNAGEIRQTGTLLQVYRNTADRFGAESVGGHRTNMIEGSIENGRFSSRDGAVVLPGVTLPEGPVCLGIRPEAVVAASEGEGVQAKVVLSERWGANRLLHCRIGENELLAVTESSFAVQEGQSVTLVFPEPERMWFDADSKRIEN